jgi:hypothetical protein
MGPGKSKLKQTTARQKATPAFSLYWFLLPAALGFLVYVNTLGHQWCLDDYSLIIDNWVTKKGWEGIPIHLSHDYRYGYWNAVGDLYRPLSPVMFAAEWAIFGNNPLPGHLINVLLYSSVCFLFGLTLYRWTKGPVFAMIAALLFAVHPVHTEVVANIKSRDELLAMFFLLLTWLFWQRLQHHRPKALYLGLSLVAFTLALFSKESAVTFLPLLPLSIYAFRSKPAPRDYWFSLVFLIPTGLFLVARQLILGDVKGLDSVSMLDNVMSGAKGTTEVLATAIRHVGEYIQVLLMPWPMVSDKGWNQIPVVGFSSPGVWMSLLVILAGLGAIVWYWKRNKRLVFGLVWFVVTISLATNLLFLIGTSYGERLLFLPSAGFAILVAALIRWRDAGTNPSWPGWLKKPIGMGFVVLLVLLSVLSMLRNPAWYNSYTLYATDIKKSPESVKLRYHYALETGKKAAETEDSAAKNALLTEALKDLEKVMSKHPTYWEAFGTAGLYAYRKGDREAAMTYYKKATDLNPNAAIAWSNMGIIYAERGDLDQAQTVYEKAVAADPRFVDAWMNLGAIKAQKGDFGGAIDAFRRGLQFDPENVRLLTMLGSAYKDSGQPELGQPYLDRASSL